MKICETFVGHQGEVSVGRFSFFIRASKCNLFCTYCDSEYAKNEGVEISVNDLVQQAIHFPCVIITGGEPFLQKEEVAKLVKKLVKENPEIRIEIETNGTIKPIEIGQYTNIIYNVSPKLTNSGNKYEDRIKPNVIDWFVQMKANFKFVVDKQDDIDEINMLVKALGISKQNVYLMPQGKTKEEQLLKMLNVVQTAKINGYNFSPRMHVLLYSNKRGV
jgi:organic radical activating enzyme